MNSVYVPEDKKTYCLLSAALSLVWIQLHVALDEIHWPQVGSLPSHFIFLRLPLNEHNSNQRKPYLTDSFHKPAILCVSETEGTWEDHVVESLAQRPVWAS